MIGPSSSHTAGAVRLGALARAIYGTRPSMAKVGLHGSFQATGDGHGTKLALIAGLLGMQPDDVRIPRAFEIACEMGMQFSFEDVELDEAHPNTAVFELSGSSCELGELDCTAKLAKHQKVFEKLRIVGSSIGGGVVEVTSIGNFYVKASGEMPLLIVEHIDQPGVIHAVTGVLADSAINVASMDVSREMRGARALMLIETDLMPDATTLSRVLRQNKVTSARVVPAV